MRNRSNLLHLSSVVLGTIFLMLSCGAGVHPDQLTVRVPGHYLGRIRITTCVAGAPPSELSLDEQGLGKTSHCPSANHSVEIEVVRTDRSYRLDSSEVHILRTGDGLPTGIEAQLTQ